MKLLPPPEIVELTGPDARAFAQAQFCNDVEVLDAGASQMSAWLNAHGKIRALFHLYCLDSAHYLMLLRGGKAVDVARVLVPFVFRSRLKIHPASGWQLYGGTDAGTSAAVEAGMDAAPLKISIPGSQRSLYLAPVKHDDATDPSFEFDWNFADVREGVPALPDTALEQFLPAWLDLERLMAISYRKGCYPGQEIVARMHFRGVGAPRRLGWVRLLGNPIPTDDVVRDPLGAPFAWILNRGRIRDESIDALAILSAEAGVDGARWPDQQGRELEVISTEWKR
ncbi:MAG: folate-binding protein [Tahibacter sp.]